VGGDLPIAYARRIERIAPSIGRAPNAPVPSSEAKREFMSRLARRDTQPELALRRLLHARGLRFRIDRAVLPDRRRRADIVFGPARVAVFVDGCFWHGCPDHLVWPRANGAFWREKIEGNRRRDRDTDEQLHAAGWEVLRAWEHEDPADVAERIARIVRHRRGDREDASPRQWDDGGAQQSTAARACSSRNSLG
jgi:DNA mismatch endonuclease, patch repair protein